MDPPAPKDASVTGDDTHRVGQIAALRPYGFTTSHWGEEKLEG